MHATCDVIRDLLPLYHDDICSQDSRTLIEEHLANCENCRAELTAIKADMNIPHPAPETEALKKLNRAWKKVKRKALFKGLIAATLALVLLAGGFFGVFSLCRMEGGDSMSPVIEHGDWCLVNRIDRDYQRGDIVCVPMDDFGGIEDMVRLVGLPGDTVSIEDGAVLVNGQVFPTESGYVDSVDMDGPVTLDRNQYFVLGDNHENAVDSRDSRYGVLFGNDILGKVQFIFRLPNLSPHISVPAEPVE